MSMGSVQWVPAGVSHIGRGVVGTTKWRLLATFVLVEAAVWTPVWLRIPSLLCLVTLAILVHRADSRPQSESWNLRAECQWLFGSIAVSAVAIGFAYYHGALHPAFGSQTKLWFYPGYVVWAIFQELLLQGIFFVSLERLFGTQRAIWITAALFAFAHVPNLFLMAATFGGGLIFTRIFATTRNFLLTGAVHALLGLTLAVTAPAAMTHGMLVGLDYVQGHAFTGATVD